MIGMVSNRAYGYGTARVYPYPVRAGAAVRPASVSPVTPAPPANSVERRAGGPAVQARTAAFPFIREGVDPVAMAVRSRIQYLDPQHPENAINAAEGEKAQQAHEVMKETECQTCKNRKYQDGSDDPSVSFKTATRLTPDQAATAVRGHEMEHVSHERAEASREGRKVVRQSVTLHTAICPECGDVYVSGGTTRTTTAKDNRKELAEQAGQAMSGRGFHAMA